MIIAYLEMVVLSLPGLLEQGLSNQDPYVPDPAFYPIYHTNMLHGLMAGLSRLSGLDPLIIWFGSLGVAKVLIASDTSANRPLPTMASRAAP